ncbi:hypothetical protein QBC43DRAFT_335298 [Cladorrhinum sp. PSN259]|nr:hypothetical protein QBC43DRAFT_335298 [Cladorrhinum sp. PSN259]
MADSDNDIKLTVRVDSDVSDYSTDVSDYSTDMASASDDSPMTGSDTEDVASDAEWFKDTYTASEADSDYDEPTQYALNQNNKELIQKGAKWERGTPEKIRAKIPSLKWSEELKDCYYDCFDAINPSTVREVIANAMRSADFMYRIKNMQNIRTEYIGIDEYGRLFYQDDKDKEYFEKDNFRDEFFDLASAIEGGKWLNVPRVKKAIEQFQTWIEFRDLWFICGMGKLAEACKEVIIDPKNPIGDAVGAKRVVRKCKRPIRSMQKIISIANAVSQDYAEGGRTSAERLKALMKMKRIFGSYDVPLKALIRGGDAKKIISALHGGIECVQRALGHTMTLKKELDRELVYYNHNY